MLIVKFFEVKVLIVVSNYVKQ